MGTPERAISLCATGWLGKRTATVSSPADTLSGTRPERGKIIVSGPGQKARIIRRAVSDGSQAMSGRSASGEAMCRISGLSPGRPLAAKMRLTASASSPFAPSP